MKKNNKSTKQRRAQAKKGQKKFSKEKKSRDEKHIRSEKRRQLMSIQKHKMDRLMQALSNIPQQEIQMMKSIFVPYSLTRLKE